MDMKRVSCRNEIGCGLDLLTRSAIVITTLLLMRTAAGADDAETDVSAKANAALVARLNSLQNLVVEYKMHENLTPLPNFLAEIAAVNQQQGRKGSVRPHTGPQDSVCTFRYLEGRYWLESRLTEESIKTTLVSSFQKVIHCYNLKGFERYTLQIHPFNGMGMVSRSARPQDLQLHPVQLVDIGLGVREWEANDWITPEALQDMIVHITDDGMAELQRLDPTTHGVHVWDFDPKNSYALVRYTVFYRGFPGVELVNSDFRNVDGTALPFHIEIRQFANDDGNKAQVKETVMEVTKYQLKSPDNSADTYHINTTVIEKARTEKP
jgi:hypothetical protein